MVLGSGGRTSEKDDSRKKRLITVNFDGFPAPFVHRDQMAAMAPSPESTRSAAPLPAPERNTGMKRPVSAYDCRMVVAHDVSGSQRAWMTEPSPGAASRPGSRIGAWISRKLNCLPARATAATRLPCLSLRQMLNPAPGHRDSISRTSRQTAWCSCIISSSPFQLRPGLSAILPSELVTMGPVMGVRINRKPGSRTVGENGDFVSGNPRTAAPLGFGLAAPGNARVSAPAGLEAPRRSATLAAKHT
jgi:hypothetical protein